MCCSALEISRRRRATGGFSLVELLAVVVIVGVLVTLGAGLVGSRAESLGTAGERFSSLVEQARTTAITRRRPVVLAIAEPGSLGFDDGQVRLGLFELGEWDESGSNAAEQVQRWEVLPGGVAFFGGGEEGLDNLLDREAVSLTWKNGNESGTFPALVFSSRGGLLAPSGSESVVVVLGGGTYRNGEPRRTRESGTRRIRIGRAVARAWNFDS